MLGSRRWGQELALVVWCAEAQYFAPNVTGVNASKTPELRPGSSGACAQGRVSSSGLGHASRAGSRLRAGESLTGRGMAQRPRRRSGAR